MSQKRSKTYTVKELARVARVTVRTLHHYDEIGLLAPASRTEAGHRIYGEAELVRLHQIRTFRALGLPLQQIANLINAPDDARRDAFLAQRVKLAAHLKETEAMLGELDRAIEILEKGNDMNTVNDSTLFDGFDPAAYEDEAKERWGETDAYKESARRTKKYKKEDRDALKKEAAEIYQDIAKALADGVASDSPEGLALAERHRLHIVRWFYPCSKTMHAGLADMYLADDRFRANMDKYGEGVTKFLSAAIKATAAQEDRAEKGS
jgi:DNA-binding transcriptional MerR regulator